MFGVRFHRVMLALNLGLLMLWAVGAYGDAPAVTVAITSPTAQAVVGGVVTIENRIIRPATVAIKAVETTVTEVGTPALILPLSAELWQAQEKDPATSIAETWDTLPMHNGDCRLTTRVVCEQGGQRFTVVSAPVTVTVKNLWITKANPATAFFAVKAKASQTITVDFDHYQATGPYRVEYSFYMPQNPKVFRTIVHEHVTTHHDTCTFAADKESLPWGAYVCFDIKVSCESDAATLISPTCKVILEDAEIIWKDPDVRIVYALSEPPKPGGLTVLCYSDLDLISSQPGLSEQFRDWEHPVVIPFTATSFRSVFVGMDNHTDNRGRSPQPIMPES